MKKLLPLVLFGSLIAASPAPAAEAVSATKKADIEQLVTMTGALRIGDQMSRAMVLQMTRALKRARPDIPQDVLDAVREEVNRAVTESLNAPGGFMDITVGIYDKYYTDAEIRQLIAFYQTPVGQKSIRILPTIMQDSILAGQVWGRSLIPQVQRRVLQRLRQMGYVLDGQPGAPAR